MENIRVSLCFANENHYPVYQLHLSQALLKCTILGNICLVVYGNEVVDVHHSMHCGI